MNQGRVRELKIQYVMRLIEILRTICQAGEQTEEHLEAVQQVENGLLKCLDFSVGPPHDSNWAPSKTRPSADHE